MSGREKAMRDLEAQADALLGPGYALSDWPDEWVSLDHAAELVAPPATEENTHDVLHDAIARLYSRGENAERDCEILRERYGLAPYAEAASCAQLAARWCLSPTRVNQVLRRARSKLRIRLLPHVFPACATIGSNRVTREVSRARARLARWAAHADSSWVELGTPVALHNALEPLQELASRAHPLWGHGRLWRPSVVRFYAGLLLSMRVIADYTTYPVSQQALEQAEAKKRAGQRALAQRKLAARAKTKRRRREQVAQARLGARRLQERQREREHMRERAAAVERQKRTLHGAVQSWLQDAIDPFKAAE